MPRLTNTNNSLVVNQADALLSQANPVSGTWYTVLDTTSNVRIIQITGYCTWTVQVTDLNFRVTADGKVMTFTNSNPVSDTWYNANFVNYTPFVLLTADASFRNFLLEAKSVKVEAMRTGGTCSAMVCNVVYARRI